MILGFLFLASAATGGDMRKCDIGVGELVPSAQVARELAEAIIRNRQTPEQRSRYVLHIEQDGNGWIAFQALPDRAATASGDTVITAGGGGLGMRIDRCNGAISEIHYQR